MIGPGYVLCALFLLLHNSVKLGNIPTSGAQEFIENYSQPTYVSNADTNLFNEYRRLKIVSPIYLAPTNTNKSLILL